MLDYIIPKMIDIRTRLTTLFNEFMKDHEEDALLQEYRKALFNPLWQNPLNTINAEFLYSIKDKYHPTLNGRYESDVNWFEYLKAFQYWRLEITDRLYE